MKQSDLQQALRELQQQHVFIRLSEHTVELWAPGASVSNRLRRVITKHRREVLQMVDTADILTCPSPDLHRAEWDYREQRYYCDVCARLKAQVS